MPPKWTLLHPKMLLSHLGRIPSFLEEDDPRSAREQFDANYRFGGWHDFKGFTLSEGNVLHYPDDPPLHPVASCRLREELILFYPSSWVCIIQPDRTFSVANLD